jgi:hypothetical protein
MMRAKAGGRHIYGPLALTIAGVLLAVGIAYAAGAWSSSASRTTPTSPRFGAVKFGSPVQRAAFSAFSRAGSTSDELPTYARANMSRQAPGAELGLSRRILADDAGAVYLLPAPGEVCAVTVGDSPGKTSQACTPDGAAAAKGFFWVAGANGSGSAQTITGVVPSGITTVTLTTARGDKTSAQVTADGGYRLAFAGTAANLKLSGNGNAIEEPLSPTPEPGH